MQMYRVKFARKISETAVDLGDVVVCATERDAALASVAATYGLPVAGTEFDVSRIKPSLFQISRRTIDNTVATFDAGTVSANKLSNATFPGVTESRRDRIWFSVVATADLHADDENDAIGMLCRAVMRGINGVTQKRSVRDLDVSCHRPGLDPRIAAVDQNALYESRRIFPGGDTRT